MPTRKTRKERFKTALLRAGISQEKWRSTYHKVSRKHLIEELAERLDQKLLPTVANTLASLPLRCATVVLRPMFASSPNTCVRAPSTSVP